MRREAAVLRPAHLCWGFFCAFLLASPGGCSEPVEVGYDFESLGGALGSAGEDQSAGTGDGESGSGGSGGSADEECRVSECRGKSFACGDCLDNDGDGLVDARDPECLGPCDDDEASFMSGDMPTSGMCRQDCYFDRDSGAGNDRCDWDQRCDVLSPSMNPDCASNAVTTADPTCSAKASQQPDTCLDSCLPLTPNGCDCFGCCELPARSGRFVWLGASSAEGNCSTTHLDSCRACTPVTACWNNCDACDRCIGGSGPSPSCTEGAPECGDFSSCDDNSTCGPGSYCITGCCIPLPR